MLHDPHGAPVAGLHRSREQSTFTPVRGNKPSQDLCAKQETKSAHLTTFRPRRFVCVLYRKGGDGLHEPALCEPCYGVGGEFLCPVQDASLRPSKSGCCKIFNHWCLDVLAAQERRIVEPVENAAQRRREAGKRKSSILAHPFVLTTVPRRRSMP